MAIPGTKRSSSRPMCGSTSPPWPAWYEKQPPPQLALDVSSTPWSLPGFVNASSRGPLPPAHHLDSELQVPFAAPPALFTPPVPPFPADSLPLLLRFTYPPPIPWPSSTPLPAPPTPSTRYICFEIPHGISKQNGEKESTPRLSLLILAVLSENRASHVREVPYVHSQPEGGWPRLCL